MTTVHLLYGSPAPDGTTPPVVGTLVWTPTRQRMQVGTPDLIVAPVGFKVPLKNGVTDVVVAPTAKNWAWRVDILIPGAPRVTTHVTVPDVEEIDFTDLVVVDPSTLQPKAKPDPIWYSWVDGLALTTANAEQAAQDAKLASEGSQTSALASANLATDKAAVATAKAAEATDKASQAGTSAFNSAASAAAALGHKNDAQAAEDGALAAESNALLYRDGAQIARMASEDARDISVSAKDDAVTAKNAAQLARTEAEALTDITVTTGAVDENGHLILSRTDSTTTDAGYVIGPPIQLEIADINTGPAPETVVGPQGPIGPKGDPGGWAAATVIPGGTSLDTIQTSGLYLNSSANANNGPMPSSAGGHMEVIASSGYIHQRYVNITENREVYSRQRYSNGTWQPWRTHNTTRVDQTAGRAIYMWDELNNRDQLIWGDTGWRQIRGDLINGWDPANGNVLLRRLHNTVYITFDVYTNPVNVTPSVAAWIPISSGFRSAASGSHTDWINYCETGTSNTPAVVIGRNMASTLEFLLGGRAPTNIRFIRGGISWPTNDAWPTTLPGISFGSIPNT